MVPNLSQMKPIDTSHMFCLISVILSHPFHGISSAVFPVGYPIQIYLETPFSKYSHVIISHLINQQIHINIAILFFTNMYDVACVITRLDLISSRVILYFCTVVCIFIVCLLQDTLMIVRGVAERCW